MATYNLELLKSPRLCGWLLEIFSRILRIPILGRILLELIKRKNKVQHMVNFASSGKLLPLYYPIHEMAMDEKEMHDKMVKKTPLDLRQLATKVKSQQEQNDSSFRHWTITDYTNRYKDGTTTPSEVAERIIEIIESMDRSVVIQCNVNTLTKQAAMSTERYKAGKTMGILDGVPVLVKDEVPVAGYVKTKGTSYIADHVEKDSFPVERLRQEGALIVGLANQHEIGIGTTGFNIFYGTPKNPYGNNRQIHYYTGGSSSGSAAAVSMGIVPLAIGADGGGSIRIPSSLCGCVGLKPTFKRVAIDMSGGCSVSHVGPITNNVHDAALAYAIMAGASDNDHRHQSQHQPPVHLHDYVSNLSDSSNKSLKGLRIGIFEEHVNDSDPNVLAATKKAIQYYVSCGAEIVPITLPHLGEIHLAHGITITSEMFSAMERHYLSSHFNQMSPETRVNLAIGRSWSSVEFLAAQKVRSFAMNHIEDLFRNKIDVIVSPATPCCAPILQNDALSHGESNLAKTGALMRYMLFGNFTGIPGIVFPIAYDNETALPISLQIQAAHWREDLLLYMADQSQKILENGVAKPSSYVNVLGDF
eukprot:scaffold16678_cov36-Cyclotella_meneghiniana.AAC.1